MAANKSETHAPAIETTGAVPAAGGTAVRAPRRKRKAAGGSKIGITKLRAQAMVSFSLGKDNAEGLLRGGFTPAHNLAIKAALGAFDEARLRFFQARTAGKQATRDFHAFVEDCRALRDRIVGALRIVSQGKPDPFKQSGLRLSMTHRPRPLNAWLLSVQVQLEKNRSALSALLRDDLLAQARTAEAKLLAAIGAQHARRKQVASMSVEQKAARKKLLASIDFQRLSAVVAFPKNKQMLRQFVPLWLKRRARHRPPPGPEALALPPKPDRA